MSAAPEMSVEAPSEQVRRSWEGSRRGRRVVQRVVGYTYRSGLRSSRRVVVEVACDCGRVDTVKAGHVSAIAPHCRDCGYRASSEALSGVPGGAGKSQGRMVGLAGGAPLDRRDERRAFCEAAGSRELWESDTAEARIAESAVAREMGRLSLAEIGLLLGMSRERVRQLEAVALGKLGQRVPKGWRPGQ